MNLQKLVLSAIAAAGVLGMVLGVATTAQAASSDCVWQASRKWDPDIGGYIYRDDGGCPQTACDDATACVAYMVIIGIPNKLACECGEGQYATACELWFQGEPMGLGSTGCTDRNCTTVCSQQADDEGTNGWFDIWCVC